MSEEKKYTVIGKVEIGTDEYRDLIENLATARNEESRYRSESWNKDSEIRNLKEQLESVLKTERKLKKTFINSSELIKAEYTKYIQDLRVQEDAELKEN